MLCTDVEIPVGAPEQGFVETWNRLAQYRNDIARTANESDDPLICYRARELLRLIGAGEKLGQFDCALSLKMLSHIEVGVDGKLTVVFFVPAFS